MREQNLSNRRPALDTGIFGVCVGGGGFTWSYTYIHILSIYVKKKHSKLKIIM